MKMSIFIGLMVFKQINMELESSVLFFDILHKIKATKSFCIYFNHISFNLKTVIDLEK